MNTRATSILRNFIAALPVILTFACEAAPRDAAPAAVVATPAAPPAAVAPAPATAPAPAPEPTSAWSYKSENDVMNGVVRFAELTSVTEVNFEFPYNGPQHALLVIGTLGKPMRSKALLALAKAQFTCLIDCTIRIKFDDADPVKWGAGLSNNGDMGTLYLDNPEKLAQKLKGASKVWIEAPFFQAGNVTFEFDARGFDPQKLGL
jgi:hypothetical protein